MTFAYKYLCAALAAVSFQFISASLSHAKETEEAIETKASVPAEESVQAIEDEENAEKETMTERSFSWIVDQRNAWSNRIGSLGRNIDGFFGGKEAELSANGSFLKVGLFGVWRKEEGIDPEPRFKFRLDLPYTQDRFKLVIENDPDETKTLAEKNRNRVLKENETTNTTSTGFFRLIAALKEWKFKGDLGIKLEIPLDPFARAKAEKEWALSDTWDFRVDESVYYYHSDGWGHTSAFYFENAISDRWFFRSKSEAQWVDNRDGWEFAEVFSLSQKIDEKRAMNHQLGWLGESRPNPRTSAYFINTTYRQRLYSDWLFLESTPELLFPRDDNFKPNPSLTLGIEMIFSE